MNYQIMQIMKNLMMKQNMMNNPMMQQNMMDNQMIQQNMMNNQMIQQNMINNPMIQQNMMDNQMIQQNMMNNQMMQQDMIEVYNYSTLSDKNHLINIDIKAINGKLYFNCFYEVDYIKIKFMGEFSIDDLKAKSNFYRQYNDANQIIRDIKNYRIGRKIKIKEKNDNIIIILPMNSTNYSPIELSLNKKLKSEQEIIGDYKEALERFKNKIQQLSNELNILDNKLIIPGLTDKIINNRSNIEMIKMWISKFKITAILLYSFYQNPVPEKIKSGNHFIEKYEKFKDVDNFHQKCDNKNNILVICKSRNEIFGGFTPLAFLSNDSYGNDNDSFVFSITSLKKYPKYEHDKNISIWRYKNYGPCFSYDLCFKENSMNKVSFSQKNYNIPKNFIDKNKAIASKDCFILDALEIYEIIEKD